MHVDGTCVNPNATKCEPYPTSSFGDLRYAGRPGRSPDRGQCPAIGYPLTRDAYIYVDKPPGRPLDPGVREFIRFVLSRQGQEIIDKQGIGQPAARKLPSRQQLRKID